MHSSMIFILVPWEPFSFFAFFTAIAPSSAHYYYNDYFHIFRAVIYFYRFIFICFVPCRVLLQHSMMVLRAQCTQIPPVNEKHIIITFSIKIIIVSSGVWSMRSAIILPFSILFRFFVHLIQFTRTISAFIDRLPRWTYTVYGNDRMNWMKWREKRYYYNLVTRSNENSQKINK